MFSLFIKNKKFFITAWSIFFIGFLINLIWENVQAPLYKDFITQPNHFFICFQASFIDALIILIFYAILVLLHKDLFWTQKIKKEDLFLLVLVGFVVSVWIEKRALAAFRWKYGIDMPLLPFIDVALTPDFQMIVLPVATFWLVNYLIKKYNKNIN